MVQLEVVQIQTTNTILENTITDSHSFKKKILRKTQKKAIVIHSLMLQTITLPQSELPQLKALILILQLHGNVC